MASSLAKLPLPGRVRALNICQKSKSGPARVTLLATSYTVCVCSRHGSWLGWMLCFCSMLQAKLARFTVDIDVALARENILHTDFHFSLQIILCMHPTYQDYFWPCPWPLCLWFTWVFFVTLCELLCTVLSSCKAWKMKCFLERWDWDRRHFTFIVPTVKLYK